MPQPEPTVNRRGESAKSVPVDAARSIEYNRSLIGHDFADDQRILIYHTGRNVNPMTDWYAPERDDVLRELESRESGLSLQEAARRLEHFGPNRLEERRVRSPLSVLAGQFTEVMVVVLLVAAAISFFVGESADAIMIHSKKDVPDEIFAFCKEYAQMENKVPLVAVPSTYDVVTEQELIDAGVNLVIYANHLLRSAYPVMVETAETILRNRRAKEAAERCLPVKELIALAPEVR